MISLDDSSPLSWQGEEGQIGPAGLNSSEGPKVSTRICCFPTGCPLPCMENKDMPTLPGPQTQGHHPGRVPSLLDPCPCMASL